MSAGGIDWGDFDVVSKRPTVCSWLEAAEIMGCPLHVVVLSLRAGLQRVARRAFS